MSYAPTSYCTVALEKKKKKKRREPMQVAQLSMDLAARLHFLRLAVILNFARGCYCITCHVTVGK